MLFKLENTCSMIFIFDLPSEKIVIPIMVLKLLVLSFPPYAASLLLGMNDGRSDKASRQRSDSPFSFPRQKRSVRPRLFLSIDLDSE